MESVPPEKTSSPPAECSRLSFSGGHVMSSDPRLSHLFVASRIRICTKYVLYTLTPTHPLAPPSPNPSCSHQPARAPQSKARHMWGRPDRSEDSSGAGIMGHTTHAVPDGGLRWGARGERGRSQRQNPHRLVQDPRVTRCTAFVFVLRTHRQSREEKREEGRVQVGEKTGGKENTIAPVPSARCDVE